MRHAPFLEPTFKFHNKSKKRNPKREGTDRDGDGRSKRSAL